MYPHKNGIVLKKIEREHLKKLLELKNESWFGTHTVQILNNDDQEKWFDSISNHKNLFLIATDSTTSEEVGVYKLQNIDWVSRRYDSGHDVFSQYRGNGYGKRVLEAGVDFGFEILNMNRIDTEILENNHASIKTADYVGFSREGLKRKCIYKCGEYINSIFYGILREEWETSNRVVMYNGVCNSNYRKQ
jgi:RimJ/RimL family protein N-acetyltransferase